jgi:regulator of RNase E activity RraA
MNDTLTKLAQFDTPTICNIIEMFDVQPRDVGYARDARIRANFPDLPPTVGYAATAIGQSAMSGNKRDAEGYHWIERHVEGFSDLDGPAFVVIQDIDDPQTAAQFGEVMCSSYQAFGGVGLLTNGAGRDIDQVRDLKTFQVFTNGEICSHGYFHLAHLFVPAQIGGLVIQPNDLLHADRNGIATIPAEIATDVAGVADEFVACERFVLDVVQGKQPTLAEFHEARAASDNAQAKLQERVRQNRAK